MGTLLQLCRRLSQSARSSPLLGTPGAVVRAPADKHGAACRGGAGRAGPASLRAQEQSLKPGTAMGMGPMRAPSVPALLRAQGHPRDGGAEERPGALAQLQQQRRRAGASGTCPWLAALGTERQWGAGRGDRRDMGGTAPKASAVLSQNTPTQTLLYNQ